MKKQDIATKLTTTHEDIVTEFAILPETILALVGKTRSYAKAETLFLAEYAGEGETDKDEPDDEHEQRVTALMADDERGPLTREEAEDLISEEDELAAEKRRGGVVPSRYKAIYRERGDATCCGDDMSQVLKAAVTMPGKGKKTECDLTALRTIASENGLTEKLEGYQAKGLNPGMQRMNIGNLMRGIQKRGGDVTIDGETQLNPYTDDDGELIKDAA